ncbi:4Fe-4S binding protein [Roseburia sp. OM04-10AA]|nr:4Fe-4S binding protein [Roseburia sp. OM04-10AA]
MIRKIIHIDKEKCNGCGLCASACHEVPSAWSMEKPSF